MTQLPLDKHGNISSTKLKHFLLTDEWNYIQNHIIDNKHISNSERIYLYYNNLNQVPICPICNVNNLKFLTFTKGYQKYCSRKCGGKAGQVTRETNCEVKYGVKNWMQSDLGRQYAKNNNTANHMNIKTDSGLTKGQQSKLIKYGDKNYRNDDKIKQTKLEKYGDMYYTNRPKFVKTIQEKYNINSLPEANWWIDKHTRYKRHEFTFPSGIKVYVQGYESKALKKLVEMGYCETDLLLTNRPTIKYFYPVDMSWHTYHPDIVIPKENIIIEVKSSYTIKEDKLKWKQMYSEILGWEFKLWVF